MFRSGIPALPCCLDRRSALVVTLIRPADAAEQLEPMTEEQVSPVARWGAGLCSKVR